MSTPALKIIQLPDVAPDYKIHAAFDALRAGLSPLPTVSQEKKPKIDWTEFQTRPMTEVEVKKAFQGWHDGIGIACGEASGNLVIFDFDYEHEESATRFAALVEEDCPGLINRLPMERTPHGGYHLWARTCGHAPRSQKLAFKPVETPDGADVVIDGKTYKPRKIGDKFFAIIAKIETKGSGGYIQCAPTEGYKWIEGGWETIPTLTAREQETLFQAARACNEYVEPSKVKSGRGQSNDALPGSDFNARGDVVPFLENAGWKLESERGNIVYFTRPGKERGVSASLIGGKVFYCFTSNGSPFDPDTGYSPFAVYALLEHDGDYSAAAAALALSGYGDKAAAKPKSTSCKDPAAGIRAASNLLNQNIPEIRWAVPGLLPEGLSVLAGNPKVKKSWLALGAILAIGAGRPVLGKFPTQPAKCLYLALEDSYRRLQDRIHHIIDDQPDLASGLDNALVVNEWPTMDDGGLEALDAYAEANPDLKLIVVDTLVKLRPKTRPKGFNAYEVDSMHLSQIKALADRRHLGVLVITHLNKAKRSDSGDPFDRITGSNGIFGVADTAMLLGGERGEDTAELKITGRDVESQDYALAWDDNTCSWTITGKAFEVRLTGERQEVLDVLREEGRPMKPAEVAVLLGKKANSITATMRRMLKAGDITTTGYGLYTNNKNES